MVAVASLTSLLFALFTASPPGAAVVLADPEPAITSLSPGTAASASSVTVTGSGFSTVPSENAVTVNGKPATVSATTSTSLQVSVPSGATSGPVRVVAPGGTATSAVDLFVPPAPFVVADVTSTARATAPGVVTTIATSGKVALLTFAGAIGDRFALQLTGGTFGTSTSNARVAVYRPNGAAQIAPTGFANSGAWFEPFTLPEAGTYTVLVDPQGTATGQVTVKAIAVPVDATVPATAGGAPVTVVTDTPGQNGAVTFSGTTNQRVSVELASGTYGTSTSNAKVSVLKPDGSALLAATGFANAGLFVEPLRLPTTGTYKVVVDPATTLTGQVAVELNDVPEDHVVSSAPGAAATTLTTTAPGQNAALTFTGAVNQVVSFQLSASTFGAATSSAKVALLKPDGSALIANTGLGSNTLFLDDVKLPVAGTYKLSIDPQGTAVGSVDVVPHDATESAGTIAPGGATVVATTTVPGQNAALTFTGAVNQQVSLQLSASTFGAATSSAKVALLKPDGTALIGYTGFGSAGLYLDTVKLPVAGAYKVAVDPQSTAVGSVAVTLNDATDAISTITPGGSAVTAATGAPGQNARLSFDVVAGQRFSLSLSGSTYGSSTGSAKVSVLTPSGSTAVAATGFGTAGTYLDAFTATASGTYTVLVDPQGALTGQAVVRLHAVPADSVVPVPIDGGPASIGTTVPGQAAAGTFAGGADQHVTVRLTSSTYGSSTGSATVSLLGPGGVVVLAARGFGTDGTLMDAVLPQAGEYRVVVDPAGAATGAVAVEVLDSPENKAIAVPGGDPVTVSTNVAGQNASVTFDAVAGQRFSIELTASTFGSSTNNAKVSLLKPGGTALVSARGFATAGTFIDVLEATASGTYRIFIDPQAAVTGQVTVRVHAVPADDQQTATPGGPPTTVTTTVPGQNGAITFPGTTGQRLSLQFTASSYGANANNLTISVLKPDGTALVTGRGVPSTGLFVDTVTLPTTGTYKIVIDPQAINTGQVTTTINDVPADDQQTATPGGPPTTVTTTVPGQNGAITFPGTTGQRLSLQFTASSYGANANNLTISVLKPDGTALVTGRGVPSTGLFVDTVTLPTTGTYKIVIDPQAINTGQVTTTINDVPADGSGSIITGGDFVTVTTTVPGQNHELLSGLAAGTKYRIRVDRSTADATIRVYGPTGAVVDSGERADWPDDVVTFTAAASGTHRILVDPDGAAFGSWRLELYSPTGTPRIEGSFSSGTWSSYSEVMLWWPADTGVTLSGYAVAFDDQPDSDPGSTVTIADDGELRTFSEGTHWAHVRAVPTQGPVSRLAHLRFGVDTVAPDLVDLTSATHGDDENPSLSDTVGFAWQGTDATSGVAGYSWSFAPAPGTDPDDQIDRTAPAVSLLASSDGPWIFRVKAVDHAGLWSPVREVRVVVDASGPLAPLVWSPTHPSGSASSARTLVARWGEAAATDLTARWAVSISQDPLEVPVDTTTDTSTSQVVEPGTWYVHVRAQDQAGRWSETTHLAAEVADAPGFTAPVAGQIVFGTQQLAFDCVALADYQVAVEGPASGLLEVSEDESGNCAVDWDTTALSGGVRSYPDGGYELSILDGSGLPVGTALPVSVQQEPSVIEVLQSDHEIGLISAEQLGEQLMVLMFGAASGLLPRYQVLAALPNWTPEAAQFALLNIWASLTPEQRAIFTGDDPGARRGTASRTAGDELGLDCSGGYQPFHRLVTSKDCAYRTEHFALYYDIDDIDFASQTYTPSKIVAEGNALEDAYDVYSDELGFDVPGGVTDVWYRSADEPIQSDDTSFGLSAFDGNIYLTNSLGSDQDTFLVQHEFFHQVQWQYIDPNTYFKLTIRGGILNLGEGGRNLWWLNESTAEWAAMRAAHTLDEDDRGGYAQDLADFIERTDKELDYADVFHSGTGKDPEYGAFVVPLYLEQEVGPGSVRALFAALEATGGFAIPPTELIELLLASQDVEWSDFVDDFRWSTYLLRQQTGVGFDTPDIDDHWREALSSLPESRTPFSAYQFSETSLTADGDFSLEASGAGFIELTPPPGMTGYFEITADGGGDVRASTITTGFRPAPSGNGAVAVDACGNRDPGTDGTFRVEITKFCPVAVLGAVSTQRLTQVYSDDEVEWSAEFVPTGAELEAGNLRLGFNGSGTLITDEIGLQRTDVSPSEVLAQGCACEGWGLQAVGALLHGGVTGATGSDHVVPLEFSLGEDEGYAHSRTKVTSDYFSDSIDVTHDLHPTTNPDIVAIDVTVQPTLFGFYDNVIYRRVFDWDVDPTPFHESVTMGKLVGADDSFLAYSSDNGFADPDPDAGPTFITAEGYFQDLPIADQGGLVDINLGSVSMVEPKTFTLFYGVTTSEQEAMDALAEVGAQVYSLGQPDVPGAQATGSPITAVFGIRMPEAASARGMSTKERNRAQALQDARAEHSRPQEAPDQ